MLILHPTDFSEAADEAHREAIRLARSLGGEIVLVHVLTETPLYARGLMDVQIDRIYAAQEKWGRENLEARVAGTRAAGVPARGLLQTGVPAKEIVRAAAEERADLIMLGTHGRGYLGRLLMGSVADRVVRTAPCPVVTVRERRSGDDAAAAGRPGGSMPQLDELRRTLLDQRRALLQQVAQAEEEVRALQSEIEIGVMERGQEEAMARLLARLDDSGKAALEAIDRALGRIANGTYGRCEGCGSRIALSRLRALPIETLCLQCAEARER